MGIKVVVFQDFGFILIINLPFHVTTPIGVESKYLPHSSKKNTIVVILEFEETIC